MAFFGRRRIMHLKDYRAPPFPSVLDLIIISKYSRTVSVELFVQKKITIRT